MIMKTKQNKTTKTPTTTNKQATVKLCKQWPNSSLVIHSIFSTWKQLVFVAIHLVYWLFSLHHSKFSSCYINSFSYFLLVYSQLKTERRFWKQPTTSTITGGPWGLKLSLPLEQKKVRKLMRGMAYKTIAA